MTILNMYSARPILPALFAARYLSWAACPHQPVAPAAGSLPRRRVLASLRALIYSTYRQQMCTFGFAYTSQKSLHLCQNDRVNQPVNGGQKSSPFISFSL